MLHIQVLSHLKIEDSLIFGSQFNFPPLLTQVITNKIEKQLSQKKMDPQFSGKWT